MRRLAPALASLLAIACVPKPVPLAPAPAHVEAMRARMDWEKAGDEVVEVLAGYLRVNTTNPPGDESLGVAYLGGVLDREGIAWESWDYAPGRGSLVARLPGSGAEAPLCLLSHIDVASSEPERWAAGKGPFSGVIDEDGYLWGRGALDMKGMGAMELMTLVWLKRLDVPLRRDVILLAVADEEVDNRGALHIASRWDEIGCSHLVNEGGLGVRDAIFEGQTIFGISTAEKGILWAQLVAEGKPGHGSTPQPNQSPDALRRALDDLDRYDPKPRIPDALFVTLDAVGRQRGGFAGAVLTRPWAVNLLVRPQLAKEPGMNALMVDTLNLTGLGGMLQPNVVPSASIAQLDSRLLPGTTPDEMAARIRHLTRKHPVHLEILQTAKSLGSPVDDPLYDALARYAVEGRDDAVVGPILSPGFTDSLLLRPLGVRAYGFVPVEVSTEEAETMHGHDERVPVDQVKKGFQRLFNAVVEVAAAP